MKTYFAHVKWFVEQGQQAVAGLTSTEWLLVALGVVAGTALLLIIHRLLIKLGILVAVVWLQNELPKNSVRHQNIRRN